MNPPVVSVTAVVVVSGTANVSMVLEVALCVPPPEVVVPEVVVPDVAVEVLEVVVAPRYSNGQMLMMASVEDIAVMMRLASKGAIEVIVPGVAAQ